MDTSHYTYNGKLWQPDLTASDNNSFFHSVFGTRTTSREYFDKHAKFRRMRWSTFLTYFENETMPLCLADVLTNCLPANQKLERVSIVDIAIFAKYVSDIVSAEQPVALEEIPILSALENIHVVVFSERESEQITVFKPNPDILGNYSNFLEQPKQVVLAMKDNVFSRLSPVDENSTSEINMKDDKKKSSTTKEKEKQLNSQSIKYKKGGSAGSRGVEFQINLLTLFLLNALHKLKNWRLSTENKQAGKFDDIVLELSNRKVILLQAKYRQNKKITFDQLLSVNSKNDDFSLPKYFFSYQEIKSKFMVKDVIICTNTYVDKKSLQFLNRQRTCSESMLHYEDANCSFFTFNDEILPHLKANIKVYYENNLQRKDIDESIISDENINDFLKNLQFYCNYPQGSNLSTVVDKILFRMKYSNNLWDKTSSQDVCNKVTEWFKQPFGEYLTEERAKLIFCEIKSDKYCEILEHYNVLFEHNDFSLTDPRRILHVIAENGYLLHAIKMYRSLRNSKSKVLYISPDECIDIQKQIIDAFELPSYTCLVIIWSKVTDEMEVCGQLGKILETYKYKKLIVVSRSDGDLVQRIGLNDTIYSIIKESVTFDDLSKDSQKRLLQKKNIVFQGYHVSLEELLSKENYQKAICPAILEKLIRDEKIKVGSKVQVLDENLARYYIDRQFKRQAKMKAEIFSIETIYEVNEKVIIISDSAGMGKSTVLTKLAMAIKNRNSRLWVIRVELNDYTGILRDLLKNKRDMINVVELLDYKESTKINNQFEKFIFSMTENVVLMLDGVDEISPDYTGLIVNLISQCKEAQNFAKIFVTTRPHMIQELEASLEVKSFRFQPFTKQNQIDFLTNYWMLNLKLDDTSKMKCERYAEALINEMPSWVKVYHHRENHFAAIPLQVRMMAEIFQENNNLEELTGWEGCKEYLLSYQASPQLPAKMNVTKLYQIFVEKKRDVFIDKGNPSGNIAANQALMAQFDECLAYHRSLALKFILEANCKLFSCYQECSKHLELNTLKIGIVQKQDNRYYFVHRTFAEYFVAESLLGELQLQNQNALFQKFLIEEILSYPQYNVIRTFFDSCLQIVVESLPSNVLENYQFLVFEIDLHRKRNTNLIHRIAAEGCTSILHLLFKCINFKITDREVEISTLCETDFVMQNQNRILGNTLNIIQYFVERNGANIKDERGRTPLHYAAKNGHLESVKFLVRQGADVDIRDSADFVALREAVRSNHFDVVKFLIEQGADIQAKDRLGHTILYEAITENHVNIASFILEAIFKRNGVNAEDPMIPYATAYLGLLHILKELLNQGVDVNSKIGNDESLIFGATRGRQCSTIEYLVQQGAEVNDKDDDGNTPLCLAASKGQLETVKLLVKCGADIKIENYEGRTALHTAASWGQLDTVQFLVDIGADINLRDSDGYTALYLAAEEGLLDTVRFLVDHGADVNIRGNDQRTALFLAAAQGELDTIRFLVRRGADINLRDSDGCTALFLAAEDGELDTVTCLVECGADIHTKDNDQRTVLHLAFRHLDTVKFFVYRGVDVNVGDNDGRSALFLATKEGNLDAVQFLVEAGADINVTDKDGSTVLHLAIFWRQSKIIRFLVERGAKLDTTRCDGWTALRLASLWGELDIIKLLVCHGADVRCKDGHAALFLAVKEGHLDVVKFFIIELGMDINTKNYIGRTALHCAASSGMSEIVKFLIEHGACTNAKDFKGNTADILAKRKGHLHLLEYLETENVKPMWEQLLCLQCLK